MLSKEKGTIFQYSMLFFFLLCLGSCTDSTTASYSGYVEGDYRFIATPASGWLTEMPWQTGNNISVGALAFKIDDELQVLAVQKAQAQLNAAVFQLADLQRGKRAQVIKGLEATREALQATLNQTRSDAKRNTKLAEKNVLAMVDAQHSQTKVHELKKQIEALDADIALARLPARENQIAAAQAQVAAARAILAEARATQARRVVYSQFEGQINAVYAYSGEWVQSGQVVIKVQSKQTRKVVFYVPESEVGRWQLHDKVMVSADGIKPQIATIREIDDQASFTPPVIYSESMRTKLVFRMVAYLDGEGLPAGLPVSVRNV